MKTMAIYIGVWICIIGCIWLLGRGRIESNDNEYLKAELAAIEQRHAFEMERLQLENRRAGVYQFLQARFDHYQKESN